MKPPNSNLAETKKLLAGIVQEAGQLRQASGGCITDAVAAWLASQYLCAANEKVAGSEEARRWEILRGFVHDWAMLRHGDHTAERLRIERERLKLAKRELNEKWETKLDAGLKKLFEEIKNNPRGLELFKPLHDLICADNQPHKKSELREWLERPQTRKELLPEQTHGISPETLKKIEQELRLL